ncbi:hypothetical protein C7M84_007337 [Penaeus vannamei]|uniref:RNase H type-1 domain-containing protein n=1 Tax=Penaeus vannamei TaxID=6689 RepID=A0A423TCE0_PENVA|nr:hypothetical protein C7M84_007337 [Penaeus vannamei]
MEKWASNYIPPSDATQLEKDFTNAIHNATDSSIPLTNVTLHAHKNSWFYNDRIRELKHRMNMFRKALHRSHSPTILESFRTLRRLVKMEISEIKAKAWLSWCETITAHTSLKEMWTNLRLASGAKRSMPAPHPHPHSEANRLALSFATRCSSTQLPASVSRKLQQLKPIRQQVIQIAIDSPAQSDTPFTLTELEKATKTSKDTTPGKAGAAMVTDTTSIAHRLSNGASILQAELYAIKLALTYALTTEHTIIHILTDSLSAVYAQKTHHLDNSLSQDHTTRVSTSLSQLKRTLRKTTFEVLHIEHRAWVHAGSPSALWYKLVTDYNPPFATATSRQSAAIFHRLRMGYRCNWEIDLRTPKACQHCDTVTNEPLLHYILDCTHIRHLRSPTYISSDRRDHSENLRLAANCLREMFETPDALTTFTANPPPR